MEFNTRNASAAERRAEQLKRWEQSDTNLKSSIPRPERIRKIRFSPECVFLAACLSGDKDEVLSLLQKGIDINTTTALGLTALHKACIDENLEMVEFLVKHGADINRQDIAGWTPLHAAVSCGLVSISRYLVEHGADVAIVNSDGDLAIDLAINTRHRPIIEYMVKILNERKVDLQKSRNAEVDQMMKDAEAWHQSNSTDAADKSHPLTGATALHVAAAKGYTNVLSLLLSTPANVNKQDKDGWTPLHAAAYWGEKEAAEMLVNAMADMDICNYAGYTCIDIADRRIVQFLEELHTSSTRNKRRRSSPCAEDLNAPAKATRVEMQPIIRKEQTSNLAPVPKQNNSSTKNEVPDKDNNPVRTL